METGGEGLGARLAEGEGASGALRVFPYQLGLIIKLQVLDGFVSLDTVLQLNHLLLKLNTAPIMGRYGLQTSKRTRYQRTTATLEFGEADRYRCFLGPKGYRVQLALDLSDLPSRALLLQKLHRHQQGG